MLDRLVCVSNQVRKTCIDSGLVASKVSTIEIGVDTPQLEKWKERFWACEFLGISQRTPLFCSISDSELSSGRIFRKHVQIIEAANHLRWHLPDFCVVVACPDENVAELRRLVIKYSLHSHFRFVGLGEVERWISASDVMIQNETNLGYSIVATQAHLMGTKVVVSGEIGSKELGCTPQQEWTNAFQCDHDDPSSLASTLVKALGAQDRSVQSKGHDGALLPTRFQASKMVQNFENLFYETLAVQRTHLVGRLAG